MVGSSCWWIRSRRHRITIRASRGFRRRRRCKILESDSLLSKTQKQASGFQSLYGTTVFVGQGVSVGSAGTITSGAAVFVGIIVGVNVGIGDAVTMGV